VLHVNFSLLQIEHKNNFFKNSLPSVMLYPYIDPVGIAGPATPHHDVAIGSQIRGVGQGGGIAALKEWPEKLFALPPMWRSSNDTTVVVKIVVVRFLPFSNWITSQLFTRPYFSGSREILRQNRGSSNCSLFRTNPQSRLHCCR
jgi:hypothetical protein